MNSSTLENRIIRPIIAAAFGLDDPNDVLSYEYEYTATELARNGAGLTVTGHLVCVHDQDDIGGTIEVPIVCNTDTGHIGAPGTGQTQNIVLAPNSYRLNLGTRGKQRTKQQQDFRDIMAEALINRAIDYDEPGYKLRNVGA